MRGGCGTQLSGLGNGWPFRVMLNISPVLFLTSMTMLRPIEYGGFGL